MIYTGYKLSKNIDDLFSSYLVFGITSLLLVQVFINIAVVIGLIPVTGVTLPLVSYGGSSLVITMYMLGIVTNVLNKNITDFIVNEKKLKNYKLDIYSRFKKKTPKK